MWKKGDFEILGFSRAGPVGLKSQKGDFYVISVILVVFAKKNYKYFEKMTKRRSSEKGHRKFPGPVLKPSPTLSRPGIMTSLGELHDLKLT